MDKDGTTKNKQRNWKKILMIGVIATVTPGGFIALGIYGIKRILDGRKSKDVPTSRPKERPVSDS